MANIKIKNKKKKRAYYKSRIKKGWPAFLLRRKINFFKYKKRKESI
jgi:hypothetical protein